MTNETDVDWGAIHVALAAPLPDSEIKHRKGRAGSTYAYIDARAVYDALDAVVGAGNWSTAFRVIDGEAKAVECTITIHGVSKADVGYPNSADDADNDAAEPWKAAYSDAVKRAAVQWGVGRFLYSLGAPTRSDKSPTAPDGSRTFSRQAAPASTAARNQGVTANQNATILKLSRLLSENPPSNLETMTEAEARETITKLSHRYNELKTAATAGSR